jgi:hypothetical protein
VSSRRALRGATARSVAPDLNAHDRSRSHIIGLQSREHYDALQTMRTRQTTEELRNAYAPRAGIESTRAQASRRSGLLRTRYRGFDKIHLQHVITAAAINLLRIASWAKSPSHSGIEMKQSNRRGAYQRIAETNVCAPISVCGETGQNSHCTNILRLALR